MATSNQVQFTVLLSPADGPTRRIVVDPKPPFFIIGSGRCGTTLMRRLLIEATGVVIPPENYALGKSDRFIERSQSEWKDCVNRVIRDLKAARSNWKDFGINSTMLRRALVTLDDGYHTIPNLWHTFHAVYAIGVSKPSIAPWGDKTPINAFYLKGLHCLFPTAKYVVMVRDVFDVAYSYGSMEIMNRTGRYFEGASRWQKAYANILRFSERHTDQVLFVHYEQLVKDPEATIREVAAFLSLQLGANIPITRAEANDLLAWPHLNAAMQDVRTGSIGKGRKQLPPAAKDRIAALTHELQVYFGYEPTGNA